MIIECGSSSRFTRSRFGTRCHYCRCCFGCCCLLLLLLLLAKPVIACMHNAIIQLLLLVFAVRFAKLPLASLLSHLSPVDSHSQWAQRINYTYKVNGSDRIECTHAPINRKATIASVLCVCVYFSACTELHFRFMATLAHGKTNFYRKSLLLAHRRRRRRQIHIQSAQIAVKLYWIRLRLLRLLLLLHCSCCWALNLYTQFECYDVPLRHCLNRCAWHTHTHSNTETHTRAHWISIWYVQFQMTRQLYRHRESSNSRRHGEWQICTQYA